MINETIITDITKQVKTELVKRGFHVPIKIEQFTLRSGEPRLRLSSEPFQTTPVIFESIEISDFGSSIGKGETGRYEVGLRVHVSYQHFGGGSNGVKLFDFFCKASENGGVYDITVR